VRLSDLIHAQVVDASGRSLGKIDDVRLAQDGPKLGQFGPALRIEGLVVGASALGVRLGFHRTAVRGPALLNAIFGRLERRARYIPWEQVVSVDDGCVKVTGEPTDVPSD
jgi:sporulation protein YlmC with PRC-barrel domain